MPIFDVHSYIPVRVKVAGVEADTHEAAIEQVEDDNDLQIEIARLIARDAPGQQIESIDRDEGALAVGYLVDQQGDEEHENSRSFDVDSKGRMTEVGHEPGARLTVSLLQRAALGTYDAGALVPALDRSADQRDLMRRIDQDHEGSVAEFIAKQLVGLGNDDRASALGRLDRIITAVTKARDAIEQAPAVAHRTAIIARHTPGQQIVPVTVDGTEIGQIVRPYYVTRGGRSYGLWRQARYCVDGQPITFGLPAILAYFRESYGAELQLEIEIYPGYYALYGADGAPRARILTNSAGSYELRVFDPHKSECFDSFADALEAARA